MELKWFAIAMVGIMSAGMAAVAVEAYTHNQCKLAYVQSTKTADEIIRICGK